MVAKPTPFAGQRWAERYRYGMNLAVLYDSKKQGAHHRVGPYLRAQDAFEGSESCPCSDCVAERKREAS